MQLIRIYAILAVIMFLTSIVYIIGSVVTTVLYGWG